MIRFDFLQKGFIVSRIALNTYFEKADMGGGYKSRGV